MITSDQTEQVPFTEFLGTLKKTIKSVFYERDNIEEFIQKRGFPETGARTGCIDDLCLHR